MTTVTIRAAKTRFSRLVEQAALGHEILITKAGKPVARLGPLCVRRRTKRRLGMLVGRLNVPDDFDVLLPPEILDAFERR